MSVTDHIAEIVEVDPSETHIMVRLFPHTLSEQCLDWLARAAQPTGLESDCLRYWLLEQVREEAARRIEKKNGWGEPLEDYAWLIPWHSWNDGQLASALGCSYSWTGMQCDEDVAAAFDAIHMAVVIAVATRLREFHAAIELAQSKG